MRSLSPDTLHLTGVLHMHGVTREVSFHLQKQGEGEDPWGNQRIGFSTPPNRPLIIRRSDFKVGTDRFVGTIGDEVRILMSFEGIKK